MKERNVGGTSQITSDGKITFYSNGNITTNGKKIKTVGDQDGVKLDVKPEKLKIEATADDAVNVYIGMFFDGTGNNRYNSEKTYYSQINSSDKFYKADTIPSNFKFVKTIKDKNNKEVEVKVKVADRDSYWNPYSNIAKLFDLYKQITKEAKSNTLGKHYILKQYVEGIGTKKDEEDDVLGSALGRSSWGILGRVEQGIADVVKEQFSVIPKTKKINKIVFDVFGFSRGAAAARHFCNEMKKKEVYENEMINDPYDKYPIPSGKMILRNHAGGLLGQKLKDAGYQQVGKTFDIEIRFLGVFDTVVGDMVIRDNLGYKLSFIPGIGIVTSVGQAMLQTIKTSLTGLGIKKVFHIVAQNEWRENFALTPTDAGYTLYMLGAHSDIGGGYANLDKYKAVVDYFDVPVNDTTTLAEKQKVKEFYTSRYFSKDKEEINIVNTYDHYQEVTAEPLFDDGFPVIESNEVQRPGDYVSPKEWMYDPTKKHMLSERKISDHYMITDERVISNKYSLVPMYVMLQKAIDNGVPFYEDYKQAESDGKTIPKTFEHEIPENDTILKDYLKRMLEIAKKQANETYNLPLEMYSHICNKYVHLSAHYGGLDALYSKTGDHYILGNYGFINHPVKYSKDENGNITYIRKLYANR
jgi:propanediol utilization protein